jgi:glycosyltransferase involved in cell wall biosynthesis
VAEHIALLLPDLEGGGAQRSMVDLACAFQTRGLRVDVLAVRAHGELRELLPPEVRVVELQAFLSRLPFVAGSKRRRALASIPALLRYLHRERPSALLATSPSSNVAAALAARLAPSATRVVLRLDSQLTRAPELAGTFTQRRREHRARRTFPWADAWIAISEGVADDAARVIGIPRERIVAIHNPVLTPAFHERASARVEDPWLGAGSPPVVMGVGRLVPQKDFATLIRAFARVRRLREVRLLILGEGPLRGALERLVGEQGVAADVRFTGRVPNAPAWMARAAVFALSSAWEGFGRVVVEALAVGCPVVSTDCPSGPREILGDGAFGPLVPVGDDAALAAAIESVLESPPDRELLTQRAGAFSLESGVDRYLEVLVGAPR